MTLRELQEKTERVLKSVIDIPELAERPVSAEVVHTLHQRMTLMEKLHDFAMNFPGDKLVSILDTEVEELTKLLDEANEEENEPEPS